MYISDHYIKVLCFLQSKEITTLFILKTIGATFVNNFESRSVLTVKILVTQIGLLVTNASVTQNSSGVRGTAEY